MRRILHEEELATLSADTKKLEQGEGRMSERHLKAEVEKRKRALEELAQEKDWIFDCSGCGVHGENLVGLNMVGCCDPSTDVGIRTTVPELSHARNAMSGSIYVALA